MRAYAQQSVERSDRIDQRLKGPVCDQGRRVTGRKVERSNVLPVDLRLVAARRKTPLAARDSRRGSVHAMYLEARFDERQKQAARARHRLEHEARVAREMRGIPPNLDLACPWIFGVVEERPERPVGLRRVFADHLTASRTGRDKRSSRAAAAIASIQPLAAGTSPVQRRKPWIIPAQSTMLTATPAASRRRA